MSYLHSLSVFLEVAKEGSFSQAAKKMRITQPTISFHIDNLEKKLKCNLFKRSSQGVTLTVYGELLRDNTSIFNSILINTENQISHLINGHSGHITLGASTIPSDYLLPPIINNFTNIYNNITFSVKTNNSVNILDLFYNFELPIAIIGIKPPENYKCHPIYKDEIVLIKSPSFKLTSKSKLKIKDLINYPFIWRESSSGTNSSIIENLNKNDFSWKNLNIKFNVSSNQALISSVKSNLGLGFISSVAVKDDLKSGILEKVDISNFNIYRDFYAIRHEVVEPTCLNYFWDYITKVNL